MTGVTGCMGLGGEGGEVKAQEARVFQTNRED